MLPCDPRADDLVRGSRPARGTVRDVDARCGREVVTGAGDADHHASETRPVEEHGEAGIDGQADVLWLRPGLAA
jgi:hypothetical protein